MAEGLRFQGFSDPSIEGAVSLSLAPNELVVLTGPSGSWMSRLAWDLAGLGRSRIVSGPGPMVLTRPPFLDPSRSALRQIENRLMASGLSRRRAASEAVRWCGEEGLSGLSHRSVGSLPEGLPAFITLALPALMAPAAIVVEDPLPGMSAGLAERAVEILIGLTGTSSVLILASDPVRFEGRARIEAVRARGGVA